MAKYSQAQLEQYASEKYAECVEIVKEMSALVQSVQPDFSTDIALRQFDIILQATLVNAAVNDGAFEESEKKFIGSIAKYSDLMPIVNAELKKQDSSWPGLTWDEIDQLESETQKQFAVVAGACIDKYAEEFVSFFAVVDKVVAERDYMNLLYDRVANIILAVVGIDGDDLDDKVSETEGVAALAMYSTLVNKKWENIVNSND